MSSFSQFNTVLSPAYLPYPLDVLPFNHIPIAIKPLSNGCKLKPSPFPVDTPWEQKKFSKNSFVPNTISPSHVSPYKWEQLGK
jgi:hypothetical protein